MTEKDYNHFKSMLNFALRVRNRVDGISLERFLTDEERQDLILYPIGQLGEHASNISEESRDKYHEILWNPIIGIRNRVFHSYEHIDMRIVYKAALDHIPILIPQLQSIIDSEVLEDIV